MTRPRVPHVPVVVRVSTASMRDRNMVVWLAGSRFGPWYMIVLRMLQRLVRTLLADENNVVFLSLHRQPFHSTDVSM